MVNMAVNACSVYDLTVPGDVPVDEVKRLFGEYCKKWVFQRECGESGYEHYQCRVSLKVKSRPSGVVKMFPGWHNSVTSGENRDNTFYVTKEDTRIAGPWRDDDKKVYIPRQIRGIELRPWQQQVVDDADVWDTRTINVIIDTKGNNGKSTLATYIGVHELGRSFPPLNDFKDISRMVMDTPKRRLYVIDMPRGMEKRQLTSFYSGIEQLKNGYAFDDRYHFKEEYFDCPNIWIFTNKAPDFSLLSNDRWKVWYFSDKEGPLVRHKDLNNDATL